MDEIKNIDDLIKLQKEEKVSIVDIIIKEQAKLKELNSKTQNSKKKEKLIKEWKKLLNLKSELWFRDDYERYINDPGEDYLDDTTDYSKVMSERKYKKIIKHWAKKTGKNVVSIAEYWEYKGYMKLLEEVKDLPKAEQDEEIKTYYNTLQHRKFKIYLNKCRRGLATPINNILMRDRKYRKMNKDFKFTYANTMTLEDNTEDKDGKGNA